MDRVDPPDSFTHAPGNVLPGIEMNVPVPKDQPLGFIFHLIPSKSALTALINAAWELSFFSRAFRIRSSMVLVLDDHRPAFLSLPPEPGHRLLVQFQTPCEPEPDQDWTTHPGPPYQNPAGSFSKVTPDFPDSQCKYPPVSGEPAFVLSRSPPLCCR